MSFGLTMSECEKKEEVASLLSQLQSAHFHEILGNLRDPLFAFVNCEIWPMYKLSVDLMNKLSETRMYMV